VVVLSFRVVWGVKLYSPAMRSLEIDSATILRNVGNRLLNDTTSATSPEEPNPRRYILQQTQSQEMRPRAYFFRNVPLSDELLMTLVLRVL